MKFSPKTPMIVRLVIWLNYRFGPRKTKSILRGLFLAFGFSISVAIGTFTYFVTREIIPTFIAGGILAAFAFLLFLCFDKDYNP